MSELREPAQRVKVVSLNPSRVTKYFWNIGFEIYIEKSFDAADRNELVTPVAKSNGSEVVLEKY